MGSLVKTVGAEKVYYDNAQIPYKGEYSMSRIKPQKCPECGNKYIWFDLHWKNCPKNPVAPALPTEAQDD